VTVAMPILHFLGLMAGMGERYWPLPEQVVGGHVVSGFAARHGRTVTALVYSHNPLDTESRSGQSFDVTLTVAGLAKSPVGVMEYQFDTTNNSYFHLGRRLREERLQGTVSPADRTAIGEAAALLARGDRLSRIAGLKRLAALGPRAKSADTLVVSLINEGDDTELKDEARAALLSMHAPAAYPANVVREVEERSELHVTRRSTCEADPLTLSVRLEANAACFFVIDEAEP
jgi:hypothetical protein